MKRALYLFILPLLLLCSCEQDAGTEVTEYMPNFIDAYYPYTDYTVQVYANNQLALFAISDANSWYWLKSKDNRSRAKFTELSIKNNDTSFNRYVTFVWGLAAYNIMPDTDIKTIDIVSSADIDAHHPAGTSLNDLFQFVAISPRDFINSNYTEVIKLQEKDKLLIEHDLLFCNPNFEVCYKPIIKPLETVSEDDLNLIGSGDIDLFTLFALEPKDKFNCPAYGKTLTITLTYDDKEPISKTFTYAKGEY